MRNLNRLVNLFADVPVEKPNAEVRVGHQRNYFNRVPDGVHSIDQKFVGISLNPVKQPGHISDKDGHHAQRYR